MFGGEGDGDDIDIDTDGHDPKIIIVMSATTSSYAGNEKVKNTDTSKKSTYEIAIFSKSLVSLDSLHGFTNHFLRYLSL